MAMTDIDTQDPNQPSTPTGGQKPTAVSRAESETHLRKAADYMRAGDRGMAEREVRLASSSLVGTDWLVDPETGLIRDKTWWERNGETVVFLIQAGLAVGGGIYLSGLNSAAASSGLPSAPSGATTLPSTTLPGTGAATGLPAVASSGAVPTALGEAGIPTAAAAGGGAAASTLPSTTLPGTGAAAGLPAVAPSGAVPTALAATGAATTGLTTAQKVAQLLRGGGQAVGAATNAAGNERHYEDDFGLGLASEQDARSRLEAQQRTKAMQDAYRANWYATRQTGPNNPKPLPALTPEFQTTLNTSGQQGRDYLAQQPQYRTDKLPTLPTGPTPPSTAERVGNWLAPGLSTAALIAQLFL